MTRLYSGKLVMLLLLLILPVALLAESQWIGVSSASPAISKVTSTGSITESTTVEVSIPGFFLNGALLQTGYEQFPTLPNGHPMLIQGSPDLQKLSFTLQLPPNGNMQVSITSSEYTEYTDIDIIPSEGNIARDGNLVSRIKGEVYSEDTFYPGRLIDSEMPYIVRNQRAQAFQVYPFQYNPVTRVLRFYHQLTIQILNSGGEGINPLSAVDSEMSRIEGFAPTCLNGISNQFKAGTIPSEKGSMLIICPQKFIPAITPLAEWRNQTGIQTEVINAEQFSGAEAIFSFVKDYYYFKGNLAYLLLVGDADEIPPFMFPSGAGDNYYSYMVGNDHYPDILVGRFSSETPEDVQIQVARTLEYEKNPVTATSWITSVSGLGSVLSPGDDGESDFQHIRNLLKKLRSTSFLQSNEFFDGSQGEGDADGNPSANDISGKINEGTGVLFYAGHGSPSSWATGAITKTVIEGLNNHGKYPLIWSAACETGNFAGKYCLAESWLRARNNNGLATGAIAALMASGSQTSYPPMEAQDKIAELMSNPQVETSTMGAISVAGMMSMNDVYGSAGFAITDTWILFGDPSLRVRTSAPELLTVNHRGTIGAGQISYSFECNADKGFACISQHGIILGTAVVCNGRANVSLDRLVEGDSLVLTVTALNFIPYMATLAVVYEPGIAELCSPINHSKLQSINRTFSWQPSGGVPEYYLFYLGTDNPPTNLINGMKITTTQVKPEFNFNYNETYYWKVVPVNKYGTAEAKLMDFSTIFIPEEGFEDAFKSEVIWNTAGMQKWENDTKSFFDGTQSIRSGKIGPDEYSSLIYDCNVQNCDFVSFWNKTSCESGDKLQFLIDGKLIAEWTGLTSWEYFSHRIEPGMQQLEWRYSKNSDSTAGDDAAWLDNVHLPIHMPLSAFVSKNGSVCLTSEFETLATAENYYSVEWSSDGDGQYQDSNVTNALYMPGVLDNTNQQCTLRMKAHGFDGCPVIEKQVQLVINPLPVITLPSDTVITQGYFITLDATIEGENTYEWIPGGYTSPELIIDSTLSVDGIKTTGITITNAMGCQAYKEIHIHFDNPAISNAYSVFPNPCSGNFTLSPEKGNTIIDKMILVDKEGKVIWQENGERMVIGSTEISVNGIASGTYFLITNSKSGRTVNPVVIL